MVKAVRQPDFMLQLRLRLAWCAMALLILAVLSCRPPPGAALWRAPGGQLSPGKAVQPAPVPHEQVPPGCLHLERVCVDQQQVVLMDPAYTPQAEARPLPQFKPQVFYNFPFTAETNPDVWVARSVLPPVAFRPAGAAEPTPDLQHPQYDSRVLPLLLAPTWQDNYGHTLGNAATYLHTHLHARNVTWAGRVALVVHTPLGMALPRFWQPLVGPLVPAHPVQTFADFSNRPALASDSHGSWASWLRWWDTSRSPPRSRCFSEMLVCPGLKEDVSLNISQTARFISQSYSPILPPAPVSYTSSTPGGKKCSGRRAAGTTFSTANSGNATGSDGTACLRVLFITRNGKPAVRQVLNQEELLERCRGWSYTEPRTGMRFAAACASYQPSRDIPTNIAAVQTADVVAGVHGAGMANAFFMRPGGAMFEVFSGGWPWQVHRMWRDQEQEPALQWWGLTVKDPAAFEPGELATTLLPHPRLYKRGGGPAKQARDQNQKVPWAGLEHLLQEHARVQATGGMAAYQQRRAAKQEPVHWYAEAGGKLKPGGTNPQGGRFP